MFSTEEYEIATGDERPEELAQNDDGIASVTAVDEEAAGSEESEPPVGGGDDAASGFLGGPPLDDDTESEEELSSESDGKPEEFRGIHAGFPWEGIEWRGIWDGNWRGEGVYRECRSSRQGESARSEERGCSCPISGSADRLLRFSGGRSGRNCRWVSSRIFIELT